MLIWKTLKLDYVVEVCSHQISDKVAERTKRWQNAWNRNRIIADKVESVLSKKNILYSNVFSSIICSVYIINTLYDIQLSKNRGIHMPQEATKTYDAELETEL